MGHYSEYYCEDSNDTYDWKYEGSFNISPKPDVNRPHNILKEIRSLSIDDTKTPYNLISTREAYSNACREISQSNIIAIDCEGENLSRIGTIRLIQILAIVNDIKKIYIFDLLKLSMQSPFLSLKNILEDDSILKLGYDLRNDMDALVHRYNIKPNNVLDLQIVRFHDLQNLSSDIDQLSWYRSCIKKMSLEKVRLIPLKKKSRVMDFDFTLRNLTEDSLEYSAKDVDLIYSIYESTDWNEERLEYFKEISAKYSVMFSNIPKRSFSEWEANGIISFQMLYLEDHNTITCPKCKLEIPEKGMLKKPKRCFRCRFQKQNIAVIKARMLKKAGKVI